MLMAQQGIVKSNLYNKVKLTEAEMREFAEVFAYYDYGNEDFLLYSRGKLPYSSLKIFAKAALITETAVYRYI